MCLVVLPEEREESSVGEERRNRVFVRHSWNQWSPLFPCSEQPDRRSISADSQHQLHFIVIIVVVVVLLIIIFCLEVHVLHSPHHILRHGAPST